MRYDHIGSYHASSVKSFFFFFWLFVSAFAALSISVVFLFKQDASRGPTGEEQGQSNVNVMCRICFFGENEGSERARRMLSCKSCGKKYHRNCLKNWAQHRGKLLIQNFLQTTNFECFHWWEFFSDLFHWSSWTCPSCRICEVISHLILVQSCS